MEELLDLKAQHPDAKLVVGNTEIGKIPCRPLGIAGLFLSLFSLPGLSPVLYTHSFIGYLGTKRNTMISVHMDSRDIGFGVREAWINSCPSILREVPCFPVLCTE